MTLVCYNFNGTITRSLFFDYVVDGLRETSMDFFLVLCSDRLI